MKTLRIARIENGWSQQDLANVCSITQVTISNIETGKTEPLDMTKHKIESLLGKIDWPGTKSHAVIISNGNRIATKKQE